MTEQQPDRAEQAFRDALGRHAEEPDFRPLTIPQRPSRAWLRPVAAAAAVLVAAGVAFTALRFLTGSSGSAVPAMAGAPAATAEAQQDRASTPSAAAPGAPWRQVSFGNVIVGVPGTWGDDLSPGPGWCARTTFPSGPFVDLGRTARAEPAILCQGPIPATQLQTHLMLQWTSDGDPKLPYQLPAGWRVSWASFPEVTVGVVHPDDQQVLAHQILGSVSEVTIDQYGCPVQSKIQSAAFTQPDQPDGIGALAGADQVVICQYDVTRGRRPGLSASSILHGDQANAVLTAIKAAPLGGGPEDRSQCLGDGPDSTAVVLRITSGAIQREVYVYYTSCVHNGFFDGAEARALTATACQPLMAPPLFTSAGWGPAMRLCVPNPGPSPTPTK